MPFFTGGHTGGEPVDFASKEAEMDHKKQEEVLRRFRMHESNVLVSTAILEEGVDIPRVNLVVRFDVPSNFPSYVHSLGRCRSTDANYVHLVCTDAMHDYLGAVAKYHVMSEVGHLTVRFLLKFFGILNGSSFIIDAFEPLPLPRGSR